MNNYSYKSYYFDKISKLLPDINYTYDFLNAQKIGLHDNKLYIQNSNYIGIMSINDSNCSYYIFDDENDIFRHITFKNNSNEIEILFQKVFLKDDELLIRNEGALLDIDDNIITNTNYIDSNIIKTVVNIQKSGIATLKNMIYGNIMKTEKDNLTSDLHKAYIELSNTLNNDLSRNLSK